ncbi:MAG: hypothetical protein WD928_04955 [Gammaproteobacteria bacterium]
MITLTTAQQEALARRHVERRIFVWCDALDDMGDPDPAGFWNDVGTVEINGRTYVGSGPLVKVATLSASTDMTIPGLRVTLSGLPAEVAALVRGSTVGQRPLEVHVGIFDVDTNTLIPPLIPRFVGVVDDIDITTPEAGGESTVVLTCESTSRALTISRTGTRSDATQHERDPDDDIYRHTNLQSERPVYFGRKGPRSERRRGRRL